MGNPSVNEVAIVFVRGNRLLSSIFLDGESCYVDFEGEGIFRLDVLNYLLPEASFVELMVEASMDDEDEEEFQELSSTMSLEEFSKWLAERGYEVSRSSWGAPSA